MKAVIVWRKTICTCLTIEPLYNGPLTKTNLSIMVKHAPRSQINSLLAKQNKGHLSRMTKILSSKGGQCRKGLFYACVYEVFAWYMEQNKVFVFACTIFTVKRWYYCAYRSRSDRTPAGSVRLDVTCMLLVHSSLFTQYKSVHT